MTPFDFLALAISVILGLAITRLISGIGISIRQIRSKKYFWLHGLWVVNMLILIPAYWWSLYSWSYLEDWNFFHFLLLIIYTTNLYLITDFLVPGKFDAGLDNKVYFMENRKLFFGLLFLSLQIENELHNRNHLGIGIISLYSVWYFFHLEYFTYPFHSVQKEQFNTGGVLCYV